MPAPVEKNPALDADPNVNVPPAIRRQAEEAERLMAELTKPAGEQPAEPVEGQPAEPAEPAQPAPAAPAAPAEPPKAPEQPAPPAEAAEWERRYNSMKGRFDQAAETMRQQAQQLQEMRELIGRMQAQPEPRITPDNDPASLLTPQDVQEYGEDFLSVVGKKARAEFAPIVKRYEQEIANLRQQLAGVQSHVSTDAKTRMYQTLDQQVPNWRDINRSDEFIGWLALPDPMSGVIRHELLKDAFARNNAARLSAFFNGFLSEAAPRPATVQPTPPTPTAPAAPKVDLTSLAAPGRAKSAAGDNAPTEKPIITRAQITAFYAAQAAGKYRGRDAEAAKLEAQIFEAQREGRIR